MGSILSYCVRELRLFMRIFVIHGSRFVHCVPVRISPVAVHSWPSTRARDEVSGVTRGMIEAGVGRVPRAPRSLSSVGTVS